MLPAMADGVREVRLTGFSHGAGCACKLAPDDLARVLERMAPASYPPEILVSPATGDDAAVVALPGLSGSALVQTVDFFTPIVDDPYDWGRIAATNALSDVYAMGGRPITAMNLVAWPIEELSVELLADVLRGGQDVADAAGVTVVGGHSIRDPEPKYGMAVTGLVDPTRIVRNSEMRPGDRLVLTKPLGLGVISTAIKGGRADPATEARAIEVMTTLNAAAAEVMVESGVRAATDVTGFGLLGHLHIALRASGASAVVDAGNVPFIPGAVGLAREGMISGGTRSNRRFVAPHTDWGALDEVEQFLLADAQTSGGLLMSVPEDIFDDLVAALAARGVMAAPVGEVGSGPAGSIAIRGRVDAPVAAEQAAEQAEE
jgi:selenide, water dikinase